jgi:hypothetical protein
MSTQDVLEEIRVKREDMRLLPIQGKAPYATTG